MDDSIASSSCTGRQSLWSAPASDERKQSKIADGAMKKARRRRYSYQKHLFRIAAACRVIYQRESRVLGKAIQSWKKRKNGPKRKRHSGKPHSDGMQSTNERRESIRECFLLVRLECCQQALMTLRQAPGQQLRLLVAFITQMQAEHSRIV